MRNIYFTTYVFGFLAIDILSKYIVENTLTTKIEILSEILTLEKIYNTGIAFSIPFPPFFLKILTVILIFGIIGYYFYERKSHTSQWYDIGFALIIGGALGNAIERIFQGYVVDFISVQHFSVFNIADSCICIGATILIVYYWKKQNTT